MKDLTNNPRQLFCKVALGKLQMEHRLRLWRNLSKKAEKTLSKTRQELVLSEIERKELTAQKEKLVHMKTGYAESLGLSPGVVDQIGKETITRNFIEHLDKTIFAISKQLEEVNTKNMELKRLYDRDFRQLKKFESLEARTLGAVRKIEEVKENKERDLQNLSRLSRNH